MADNVRSIADRVWIASVKAIRTLNDGGLSDVVLVTRDLNGRVRVVASARNAQTVGLMTHATQTMMQNMTPPDLGISEDK